MFFERFSWENKMNSKVHKVGWIKFEVRSDSRFTFHFNLIFIFNSQSNKFLTFIYSVTTASSSFCIRISDWISSVTTVTQSHAHTVNHKTLTSLSRWTIVTPTNLCSSSSSGHDMRPRWILQNPRHRQKSEAATNPVICRWRTESLTWWEVSQAQSGVTNRCGTYQTVPTQHHQCKWQMEAHVAVMVKIHSGNRHSRRQYYRLLNMATSTLCGDVRR